MIIRSSRLKPVDTVIYDKDKFVVKKAYDIDPLLEQNKYLQSLPNNGFSQDRKYRHIGSIPLTALMEFAKTRPEIMDGDRHQRKKAISDLLKMFPEYKTCGGGV